ncbi:hypothetical protein L7F22_053042 [Adiantum nelumboides]|nr:hypothetical protein [Adiantum nelumboides]
MLKAIDAVDNGVNQYDTDKLPRYVDSTRLSGRVAKLNPDWIEVNSPERENDCFKQAMELAGQEFLDWFLLSQSLQYCVKSWLPARAIVSSCIQKRKKLEQSGQIMMLDRYCPWKEHIHELEEELQVDPSIKYVLYQDERNWQWRIQAVVVAVGKFESRLPLPAAWRGLVDEKLSEVVGVDDCVFVHNSGFIGGNISFEGVLAMGKKALELT